MGEQAHDITLALASRYIFNGQIHKYIMNSTHAYRGDRAYSLVFFLYTL